MQPEQAHEDAFLQTLWDEETRIIGIDWKESTSDFRAELTLFAGYAEKQKAHGILVDVSKFRHRMAPNVQAWRVKNISSRYNAAGVKRFAFLFPEESQFPSMPESSEGEVFLTRAFNSRDQAVAWLTTAK